MKLRGNNVGKAKHALKGVIEREGINTSSIKNNPHDVLKKLSFGRFRFTLGQILNEDWIFRVDVNMLIKQLPKDKVSPEN
eukprot:snap_masked-scaffold_15-processed-gene-9.2-mRNA-1 protein AED:1.00 eAED:1.00 QI:0/-1/0/0/-1/1/1/0/79